MSCGGFTFVRQTANNFPEFLYTLIFQIEYKILVRNSNVDMNDVHSKYFC